MHRRRQVVRAVIAVTLVSVTGGFTGNADDGSSPSSTRAPRPGGSVVFGVLGAPPTLDPYTRLATDLTLALFPDDSHVAL